MDNTDQKRNILKAFSKAVDQRSFVLKENPEVIFQQLYDHLYWQDKKEKTLSEKLDYERRRYKKPWLHLITRPAESSPLIRTLTGHTDTVACCAFTLDDTMIISSSSDDTLRIWDAETGEELAILSQASSLCPSPSFSLLPDGKRLLNMNGNGLEMKICISNITLESNIFLVMQFIFIEKIINFFESYTLKGM